MKRFSMIFAALLAAVLMNITAYAEASDFEGEVRSRLSEADTADIADGLERVGIEPDDPESVNNLTAEGILGYIADIVKEALGRPLRIILIFTAVAAVSRVASALSTKAGLYGELFVIICFLSVSPYVIDTFSSLLSSMLGCQAFMASYIPVFAAVTAASGNVAAAASYNAIVLYFCELAAAAATTVLRPILACMLVMSVTQAINPDLSGLTAAVRNALTVIIGFIMTVFLGVIGLQTLAGRGADGIAVKAGKYAVSSFVPVIGYSLSESYKAVSVSLSAIRTTVGTFGIVILCVFMLSPIITASVYKMSFSVCSWLCRLSGADGIASLAGGLADVFGFASTVLTVFMLMLTVATGMLIILGGDMLL